MECLTHFGSQSGLLWGYQLKCLLFLYKLQELDYGRSGLKDMSSNAFLIFKIFRHYFNTKRTIYPGDIVRSRNGCNT
uniref:Uncharacterized protein n=1 Tax=Glossina palpalis gambiensis TaxID=67801 RepID=A0A1B0BKE2_9MUSC